MKKKMIWIGILVLGMLLVSLVLGQAAVSATVAVDSPTDDSDGDTSDIESLLNNPGGDRVISLREAMEAANNTTGGGTIEFKIDPASYPDNCDPKTGVCVISKTGASLTGVTVVLGVSVSADKSLVPPTVLRSA